MIWSKLAKLLSGRHNRMEHKQCLHWLIDKTRPFFRRILLLLLFEVLIILVGYSILQINKRLIDGATMGSGALDINGFALLVAMTAASVGLSVLSAYFVTLVHEWFAFGVRFNVYERLLNVRWIEQSSFHSGDLMTRMTGDVDAVAMGIAELIPNFFSLILRLAISFGVLCHYEPLLALSIIVLGPMSILVSVAFGGRLRRFQKRLKENESNYRAFMQESVTNVTIVKTFQQEAIFAERLSRMRDERLQIIQKRNRMTAVIRLLTNGMFSLGYLLAFGFGIYRLSMGEITYGTMSVFLGLVSQIQGPLMLLPTLVPKGINVLASAGRVMEIDAMRQEPRGAPLSLKGPLGIRFTQVHFAYGTDPVLRGLSLAIEPGEKIGLVGESGAGKTTVARLLLGLVDPDKGNLELFDATGQCQEVGAESRAYLSYVAQGNTLFSGSIRDNLRLADPTASDDEMFDALRIADAGFVGECPSGLDMLLTERGGTISEGEAQRIAIARAILRKRPILILDEATSALDRVTEETIIRNLIRATQDVTCVVISHRASLLHLCTRCYQLSNGEVCEASA